jgi:large subunit ribosomal protein L22
MVTARLQNYRQSPRKVRLVANFIRGKKIADALMQLDFVAKKAADPIRKLIASAVANAKNNDKINVDDLIIKEIRVDKGVTLYRSMPRAHGRAFPIRKRCSPLIVSLDTKKSTARTTDKKLTKAQKKSASQKKVTSVVTPKTEKVATEKVTKKVAKKVTKKVVKKIVDNK